MSAPIFGASAYRRCPQPAIVFIGGAAGTAARYAIEQQLPHTAAHWPTATFGINLIGAFVLGMLLESLSRRGPDSGRRRGLRLLCGTGFCGAFTTYSTFALETLDTVRGGYVELAVSYAAASVILGVLAAWGGIMLAARIFR